MIRTREELLEDVRRVLGDRTDDDALAVIENISDTLENGGEDWQRRYEDNDREWRERYRARFFDGGRDNDTPDKNDKRDDEKRDSHAEDITISDLFE